MEFVRGFFAPIRGFLHLASRPRLWPFAATPVLLNVVLVAVGMWLWFSWAEPRILHLLPQGDGWLATLGTWTARILLWIAAAPLLLGLYLVFANLVGAPFYEVLCAKTEAELLGFEAAEVPRHGIWRAVVAGLRVEAGNLLVAIAGGALAFAAPLVLPGFGAVLSLGIGWFLAGFDFIAYPFDRRSMTLRSKLAVAFDHLPATLGFGIAVYVLLIPVVTLPFVAPCAVVGAARLFPGARRHAGEPFARS